MHDASAARLRIPFAQTPPQETSSPATSSQQPPSLESTLLDLLGREKSHPVTYRDLRRDIARTLDNQPDGVVRGAIGRLVADGTILELGDDEYFLARNLLLVEDRVREVMAAYHATFPFAPAVATGEVKKRFSKGKTLNARRNIDPRIFDRAMAACKERGEIQEGSDGLRLATFTLSEEQQQQYRKLESDLVACIAEQRYYVVDLDTMADHLRVDANTARTVLSGLLKAQRLVKYGEDRYLEGPVMSEIKAVLARELAAATRLTIGEIKNLLDIPRNTVIPLMEYLDDTNFTRRDGNSRVLA